MAIPDGFGINHDCRPVLALVETARLVNTNAVSKTCTLGELLQLCVQFTLAVSGAGRPRRTLRTCVRADKNMMLKWRQNGDSSCANISRLTGSPSLLHMPARF